MVMNTNKKRSFLHEKMDISTLSVLYMYSSRLKVLIKIRFLFYFKSCSVVKNPQTLSHTQLRSRRTLSKPWKSVKKSVYNS